MRTKTLLLRNALLKGKEGRLTGAPLPPFGDPAIPIGLRAATGEQLAGTSVRTLGIDPPNAVEMLALLESPVTQTTPHTILPKGLAEKLEGVGTDAAAIVPGRTNHQEMTGIHEVPRKDEAVKWGVPIVRKELPPIGNLKRPLQVNVHARLPHARPETGAQRRPIQP